MLGIEAVPVYWTEARKDKVKLEEMILPLLKKYF
jgi:hypothetical protein